MGCGLLVRVTDGQITNIEGNPASPINQGNLCPKGAATYQTSATYRSPTESVQMPCGPFTSTRIG